MRSRRSDPRGFQVQVRRRARPRAGQLERMDSEPFKLNRRSQACSQGLSELEADSEGGPAEVGGAPRLEPRASRPAGRPGESGSVILWGLQMAALAKRAMAPGAGPPEGSCTLRAPPRSKTRGAALQSRSRGGGAGRSPRATTGRRRARIAFKGGRGQRMGSESVEAQDARPSRPGQPCRRRVGKKGVEAGGGGGDRPFCAQKAVRSHIMAAHRLHVSCICVH